MSGHSREGRPPHAPGRVEIRRLTARDSAELFRYLSDKDVWPAQLESDLATFLGRNDAAVFAALADGAVAGVVSCILDGATLRLVHFVVDAAHEELASALLSRIEEQARALRANVLLAQIPGDSQAHRRLAAFGYREDFKEQDVLAGRAISVVDLIKLIV
jgi:GNAT superfamily N-acetyltransferase